MKQTGESDLVWLQFMFQSKYNLKPKPILRMGQDLGAEWGAQRGSLGCGSLTLALEESRPPQTDGALGCTESSSAVSSNSQEANMDMEGQWLSKRTMLERGHLVPTLFQLVPRALSFPL